MAELRDFRQTLSIALIRAGMGRQIDPAFNPHVTLSYDFSDVPEMSIEPIRWTICEFCLVDSLLGKHKHIREDVWKLLP